MPDPAPDPPEETAEELLGQARDLQRDLNAVLEKLPALGVAVESVGGPPTSKTASYVQLCFTFRTTP